MAKKSQIAKAKKMDSRRDTLRAQGEKHMGLVSTRTVNRCKICGRPRAYIRHFGLCRLCFREMALRGELSGVTKASK
jgi:small subunit ribosomal protein S14